MKRPVVLLIGLPLFLLAAGALLWSRLPKDVTYHARSIAQEYGDRDADRLYGRIFEFEREKGLTADRFRAVYGALVAPRLRPFRTVDPIKVYRTTPDYAAVTQDYVDDEGHRLTIELSAELTPEGGRLNLFDVLKPAWYADYVHRTGKPITEATFGTAVSEGLSKDIPTLERLGIQRFWVDDPDGKGQSLDGWLRWYQSRIPSSG